MRLQILCPLAPAVAVAVLFAGCGGADGEIPATAARALVRGMDDLEQGVRSGECKETQPTLRRLSGTVRGLPEDVDPEVRATLDSGIDRLERLVEVECRQRRPEPVEDEPEQPIVPPPVETVPEAPPTTTEPPVQTQPEPEEEPTEEAPKEEQPKERQPKEKPKPAEPPKDQPKPDKPPKDKLVGDGRDPCPPGASARC